MKYVAKIGAASVVAVLALAGNDHVAYSAPSISVSAVSVAIAAARSASDQSRAAAESAVRDIRDRLQTRANEACGGGVARTPAEHNACVRAASGQAYYR